MLEISGGVTAGILSRSLSRGGLQCDIRRMRSAKTTLLILALAAGLFAAPSLRAQEPAYVSLSAGAFNLRSATRPELGGEVRFKAHRFSWLPRFIPAARAGRRRLRQLQGRFLRLYRPARRYAVADPLGAQHPVRARRLQRRQPAGFKLGGPVEFRSGIELSRQVGDRGRIGLMLFHISNAHIYVRLW